MSLIVQALKRAQEGATRRPPLSGHQTRGPFPGPTAPSFGERRGRVTTLVGLAMGAAVLVGGGLWVARGSMTRAPVAKAPQQVLVVEVAPPAPAVPKLASEAGTSIEEVRAALLAAQPLETVAKAQQDVAEPPAEPQRRAADPAPPAPGRTGSTKPAEAREWAARPVPPRVDPVPPIRAESTTPPIDADVPMSRPNPRPPATPAAREASAIVRVHPEPTKEAADALAAGLRDQQGGQTAKAIDEYRRGIRADARNSGLHNNLGVALRESGRLDEAIEAFQAALDIDPKYEKALNNLGVSRYQQGNYAEAVDLFSQALRINPANVESSINLGMIYFLAQRWDEALNAFQQALKYNPRSAEAHYNLGLFWERHGDHEKALQAYRKFVELAGAAHAPLAARVTEHVRQMERSK
jgi:tetratricopeptide (TPR) repeat protein